MNVFLVRNHEISPWMTTPHTWCRPLPGIEPTTYALCGVMSITRFVYQFIGDYVEHRLVCFSRTVVHEPTELMLYNHELTCGSGNIHAVVHTCVFGVGVLQRDPVLHHRINLTAIRISVIHPTSTDPPAPSAVIRDTCCHIRTPSPL